jgi:putative phosphoribosyl transferase
MNTTVEIPVRNALLAGDLAIPENASLLVLFAHDAGSKRERPRNRKVAAALNSSGIATLLFDLLTPEEEETDRYTGHFHFNIVLLSERLIAATQWAARQPDTMHLPIAYFGSRTGAAAALIAAADGNGEVRAVVSRGGRPDLVGDILRRVKAPTLLIVGGNDDGLIDFNCTAMARLHCAKELRIVSGATHLFEEPGALEAVTTHAADWFLRHSDTLHSSSLDHRYQGIPRSA